MWMTCVVFTPKVSAFIRHRWSRKATVVYPCQKSFFCRTRIKAIPAVCFTEECQVLTDQTSLVVMGIPLAVAFVWIAYLLRPIPRELLEEETIFTDPDTGVVFQTKDGERPERDKKGALVFKAIGFTPWPVATEEEGERIRIDVGPIDRPEPRTYVFRKVLRFPSVIFALKLPRPLGIVFGHDAQRKGVIIKDVIPGSNAEKRQRITQMTTASNINTPMEGDMLRAITCTNFVYPTGALLGMKLPEKHIVVFGADGQPWKKCCNAFNGSPDDGDVVIILERPLWLTEKGS